MQRLREEKENTKRKKPLKSNKPYEVLFQDKDKEQKP